MITVALLLIILFVISLAFFIIGSLLRKKEKKSLTNNGETTPGMVLFGIGAAGIMVVFVDMFFIIIGLFALSC